MGGSERDGWDDDGDGYGRWGGMTGVAARTMLEFPPPIRQIVVDILCNFTL